MTRGEISALFARRAAAYDRRNAAALAADYAENCVIDGDRVSQEIIIEGKDVGTFLGLPPTGRSFRVPGVFLYDLKDGLIVRERRIYDLSALLIQVGLLKVRPS